MSVKVMAQVWELDLPHAKKFVLLALADHANDEGRDVFPSVERVAWKTGYSIRQVQRIMHELVDETILRVEAPATRRRAIEYSIHPGRGKPLAPFKSAPENRGAILTPHKMNDDKNDSDGVPSTTTRGAIHGGSDVANVTLTVNRTVKESSENRHTRSTREKQNDSDGLTLHEKLRDYEAKGGSTNPAAPTFTKLERRQIESNGPAKVLAAKLERDGLWPPGGRS